MEMKEYIPQIIATAITLIINPSCKYLARRIVRSQGMLKLKTEGRILQVLSVVSMIINFTCILFLTIIWGVEPQHMLVGLSSIFAVVGIAMFAQWSLLSNITAGVIIFFTMPFRVGDEIRILDKEAPIEGVVESMLVFSIHLRTADNEMIILSNSLFMQKTIALKETK